MGYHRAFVYLQREFLRSGRGIGLMAWGCFRCGAANR